MSHIRDFTKVGYALGKPIEFKEKLANRFASGLKREAYLTGWRQLGDRLLETIIPISKGGTRLRVYRERFFKASLEII